MFSWRKMVVEAANKLTARRASKPVRSDIDSIYKLMVEGSSEIIFWTNVSGRILGANQATCDLLGYTLDELKRASVADIDPEITWESHQQLLKDLSVNPSVTVQTQPRRKDGSHVAMEFTVKRIAIDDQVYLYTYGREIVLEKQLRNRVLAAMATGMPLAEILTLIVELVEKTRDGIIASILLLDENGRLRIGASLNLPDVYLEQIDGLKPGPGVGSCGTAVFSRSSVMVSNIATSPLWTPYQDLAELAGVQACWSEPIFAPDEKVLGTLAMYFRNPQVPTNYDLELMKTIAHLAEIAIVRAREHELLLKSEIRYRSLIQSTAATVWTTGPDGNFVVDQDSWQAFTGQGWDEHQGFGWAKMIHPDDRERLVADWTEATTTQKPFESKGRLWHAASDDYRYFEVQAVPIIDNGQIVEWMGCTTDLHDRKIAKKRFLRSQAILAQAQEVARLGSWVWDVAIDRVQWTDEFCRLHGFPLDQSEGNFQTLMETVFVDDRKAIFEKITTAIKTGIPLPMEYRILGPDGCLKTIFSKMKLERNDTDKITGMIGTVLDVTDLRKTEQALMQSERQLRTITDSLPVLISYLDTEYRFQFVNAGYETLYQKSHGEIIGLHIGELVGDDAFQNSKKHFLDASQGISTTYEQHIEMPDGRRVINEVRLVPDQNVAGDVIGFYVLVDDITARRALEKEVLNIATEEQRRIGQDLHDGTGQELTGLGMIADTLLLALSRRSAKEQQIAEKLATGIKGALRQVKLLARGLNPVDISSAGLQSALTEMADHVEKLYSIRCYFHYDAAVELNDNQVSTQLYRIAQEATTNAVKHGQATEVTIQLSESQEEIVMSVVDNGIGISPTVHFPTGMGLRTMHYRAGVIGGRLTIGPTAQGGTDVSCRLPRHTTSREKPVELSPPRQDSFSFSP